MTHCNTGNTTFVGIFIAVINSLKTLCNKGVQIFSPDCSSRGKAVYN
jgi:hypothetical protein